MMQIIPSEKRHHVRQDWLDTRFHFSFADYYDPANMNFGVLRVFNDDTIAGGGGFDFHPHRDMEIITVVYQGALTHQDNLGNRGDLTPGEVQVMSAGKGIMHAEFNASETEPLKLLQIWLMPRNRASQPRWDQKRFDLADRQGRLQPVVSSGSLPGTLTIDQDAAIYLSTLKPGQEARHVAQPGRKAYLFVVSGSINLNGQALLKGDQARITDEINLNIVAKTDAELILLDLP